MQQNLDDSILILHYNDKPPLTPTGCRYDEAGDHLFADDWGIAGWGRAYQALNLHVCGTQSAGS